MIPPLPPFIWDPVTTDCRGGPEPAPIYLLAEVVKEPAGFVHVCATDPESGEEVCRDEIQYTPPVLVQVHELMEPTFPGDAVYTPGPGGVTFLEVAARDLAGNVSSSVCQ